MHLLPDRLHLLIYSQNLQLEPGGYLQWDELDTEGLHIESPNSVSSDATGKLFRATKIPKGTRGKDEYGISDLNVQSKDIWLTALNFTVGSGILASTWAFKASRRAIYIRFSMTVHNPVTGTTCKAMISFLET